MKKILVFCFAALMFAACSEKNVILEKETADAGFPYTITATIAACEQTPAVRTAFTTPDPADPKKAKWTVQWSVGDEIHVFNQTGADNTVAYVVTSVEGGKATFALKDGEDVSKFSDATTFYAGKTIVSQGAATHAWLNDINSDNEGGINIGLGSFKCISENSINNGFCNLVAKATVADGKLNFNFFPAVSYFRVTVPEGVDDIGCFYFQSGTITDGVWATRGKGDWQPSGYYRVRMKADVDSVKTYGQRYDGGSVNAPFYYGEGSKAPSKPYPAFAPGVYYFPIVTGATVNHLVIQDLQGTEIRSITFDSPAMEAGHIYDLGTIPAPAVDFAAGDVIKVKGAGVAAIDADHHMSYLPAMNYHPDRTVSPYFSDYCSYKNDAGTNPRSEFFNYWTGMYNETTDVWDKYFDYEIFVSLVAGEPLYLYTDKGAYFMQKGDFTWKNDVPAANGHEVGGQTAISIVSAEKPFFTVPTTDIYRIRFNIETKFAYVSALSSTTSTTAPGLKRAIVRFWPSQNQGYANGGKGGDIDLTYQGHGVWSVDLDFDTNIGYNGTSKNAGYKFLFGGLDQDQPYGKQYAVSTSTAFAESGYVAFDPSNVDLNYWSVVPVQGSPWNNSGANGCWTFYPDQGKGAKTVTVYMNDTYGAYVHSIVAK